jgi:hypothetical protein
MDVARMSCRRRLYPSGGGSRYGGNAAGVRGFAIARNAVCRRAASKARVTVAEAPTGRPCDGPEEQTAAQLEAFAVHAAVDTPPSGSAR